MGQEIAADGFDVRLTGTTFDIRGDRQSRLTGARFYETRYIEMKFEIDRVPQHCIDAPQLLSDVERQ